MKKSELKKMIKEELLKEDGSVNLNGEILDAIDNMHALFNKLKNNAAIPRGFTRRLDTDFKPLYETLKHISDIIMKKK
jgi:hypothetical protein